MKRSLLSLAVTAASVAPLAALADGRIEGVVGSAGTTNIEGAVVVIEELDRRTATRRDGSFTFGSVPAGRYTVRVEYFGADPVTSEIRVRDDETARTDFDLGRSAVAIENIVVYGQAAQLASALNRQRAADSITSIVSGPSIGALPDQNAAEALSRVPGTFLERDQGEGRYIGIRGIDADLNTTSINGLRVPAPEDDKRAIQLDVVPSELLGSLEVTKSVTPDMDGDTLGGSINIESVSAFDRRERAFTFQAESTYSELTEDTNPRVNGSYSDIFDFAGIQDSLGVAVALSWYDRDFGSDNVENGDGWPDDVERIDGSEFRGAEEIEQRDYLITRERFGAAVNLDFRPNDRDQFYLRTLFSEASDQEFRMANIMVFEDEVNGGARNDSTEGAATWDNAPLEKEFKDRYEEASVLSVALGGTSFRGPWTIDYRAGYSQSEQDTPDDRQIVFVGEGLTLGYDGLGEEIGVFGGSGVDDDANFEMDEFGLAGSITEDEETSFQLDFTRDLSDLGYSGTLQFGGKVRLREKFADAREAIYDGFPGDPTLADGFAAPLDYDVSAPFIGSAISESAVDAFVAANLDAFDLDADETLINDAGDDYEAEEDVFAAYAMTRWERGPLLVVGGLRYEYTDFAASSEAVIEDEATGGGLSLVPVGSDTSYGNLLPSITMRWRLNDAMQLRAAASQTLARPEFSDVAPISSVELEDAGGEVELAAELGNPELDPYQSTNLDAAFEWYFGEIGLLSVGVFYKDIEDFVVVTNVGGTIDLSGLIGNIAVADADVFQPINGDQAELYGLELAFSKRFSELPAPLDGLLVNANATFTESEASIALRPEEIDLPGQSDTVANLILGYEKGPLSLRLSGTFTGERLEELVEPDDALFDRYQSDHFQVDFAGTWDLTERWQLSAEVVNINDEPFYANFGRNDRFNSQFEEYGRTFTIGVRYSGN